MSSLKKSKLFIDETNYDPMDTLAPIIHMGNFPNGEVPDTPQNRANAALACCVQLTRQLRALRNRVHQLEDGTDK